jgi:hypothetical protein
VPYKLFEQYLCCGCIRVMIRPVWPVVVERYCKMLGPTIKMASILLFTSMADSKAVFPNGWSSHIFYSVYKQMFNSVTYRVSECYFLARLTSIVSFM